MAVAQGFENLLGHGGQGLLTSAGRPIHGCHAVPVVAPWSVQQAKAWGLIDA